MYLFKHKLFLPLLLAAFLVACSSRYLPQQKFSPAQLQQDLDLAWRTYQQVHPSYNWYTPAHEVDAQFAKVRASFTDSLTEAEFRLRLSYAVAAIRCGHTSVHPSKAAAAAGRKANAATLPLQVKVWGPDSMVVVKAGGNASDSIRAGMIITAIDSVPVRTLLRQLYQPISVDGYNPAFAEAIVSASFAARLRWLYGEPRQHCLSLLDSAGYASTALLRKPAGKRPDTSRKPAAPKPKKPTIPTYGQFQYWNETQTAYLQLNSFSGKGVARFIRRSFRRINSAEAQHLIIDLRNNAGGKISNSTLLGKYVAHQPFRVADSVSAVSFKFPKPSAVQAHLFYQLFSGAFTRKMPDGRLHMRQLERHENQPKRRHHFDGNLYVLTEGRSFSASLLFLNYLQQRPRLTVVGTETGGAARGNSAVMTPYLTLTHTQVRVRLPLFRLVTNEALPHNGRGYIPQVLVPPTSGAIRTRTDAILETTKKLIHASRTIDNGQ